MSNKPIQQQIIEVDRVYLLPDNLIDQIKKIRDNPQLQLLKISVLASPKGNKKKSIKIGEGKLEIIENPLTIHIPRKVHEITNDYTIDDLIEDLEEIENRLIREYAQYDIRLYADYLLILDKGIFPNHAHVIAEFEKFDEVKITTEVGIQIAPESKPLDIIGLYKAKKDEKKEIFKKGDVIRRANEIKHYVEAQDVCNYTRNLFKEDICGIRSCNVKKILTTDWRYEPFPEGSCKIGNKKIYFKKFGIK